MRTKQVFDYFIAIMVSGKPQAQTCGPKRCSSNPVRTGVDRALLILIYSGYYFPSLQPAHTDPDLSHWPYRRES